jgi:hypothetical protein
MSLKHFLLLSIIFFLGSFVFEPQLLDAQSAERLEALLDSDAVSYEQATAFVLEAAEVSVNSGEAFRYASEQSWLPRSAKAADNVRLDGLSLLVMKAFELKGGAFYSIFKNPHYAYRELQYRKIIEGMTAPAIAVSGDLLFFIVNRVLEHQERLSK